MQFSVHINPLPRPDQAKLPLQLFSITENMAGRGGEKEREYRDGSLWEQLVHSSAHRFIHSMAAGNFICSENLAGKLGAGPETGAGSPGT